MHESEIQDFANELILVKMVKQRTDVNGTPTGSIRQRHQSVFICDICGQKQNLECFRVRNNPRHPVHFFSMARFIVGI